MANSIDFIRGSAAFMVSDRPDLYTHDLAVRDLSQAMEDLRSTNKVVSFVSFSSYVLARILDLELDVEEFILAKKLSGLQICLPEADVRAYSYGPVDSLPHVSIVPDDETDLLTDS